MPRKKYKLVEELEPGDVVIIDGKKYKFGHRYRSLKKGYFNLWMESGRERFHKVAAESKVEVEPA